MPFAVREIRSEKPLTSFVRFSNGEKIPDDIILTIEQIANTLSVPITWQKGDIAIIDNTRILHGRRTLTDTERLLYSRMSGIPYLN